MIVPSIDILGGRALQLKGGDPSALEVDAGDPRSVAARFSKAGPLAVIDLDAALGRGDNRQVIRELCRSHRCRVGGGLRTVDAAMDMLDAGAEEVILGTAARPEILERLPRERVIAAVDARDDRVVVEGWTKTTSDALLDRIAALAPYVGGFLVTFVEREGRLGGTDLERAERVVSAAGDAKVTIAGGITSADEVGALDRLGADAQLGMAIYTGRLSLGAALWACLRSDRSDGLVPTVVVGPSGEALGLVYSSEESLSHALEHGVGAYHSRSRGGLWVKGETSGHRQALIAVDADCDRDALRFRVRQEGGFCHLETQTCWGEDFGVTALASTLHARKDAAPAGSYTRRLYEEPALLEAKLREEIEELVAAQGPSETIHEAADVLFFALVALARSGARLEDLERELDRRRLKVRRRPGDRKDG